MPTKYVAVLHGAAVVLAFFLTIFGDLRACFLRGFDDFDNFDAF